MKRSIILAVSALLAVSVSATAQEVPARIKDAGKLVIATMPNYPPITFKDPATNELQGFDIDLGESIAKGLGVKAQWEEIAFVQMLPSLQTARVDMVLAGMSDTLVRQETADFVDYLKSGAQFYTSTALATEMKTPEDLCGKSVGASRSTNWPAQITGWSDLNCVAKGKPAITVVGTEGSSDARNQIKTGRLQGAAQGNETLPYNQKIEPDTYVALGEPFSESIAGIPFVKTDPELRDAVKAVLEKMHQDGTYDQLLAKYGLDANKLPAITINQGK
jgi:polar amino acid transport system substrate-binding protein